MVLRHVLAATRWRGMQDRHSYFAYLPGYLEQLFG